MEVLDTEHSGGQEIPYKQKSSHMTGECYHQQDNMNRINRSRLNKTNIESRKTQLNPDDPEAETSLNMELDRIDRKRGKALCQKSRQTGYNATERKTTRNQ